MSQNKTQVTGVDPVEFVASVEHPTRRADAEVLLELMGRVTGCLPQMWGPSIVGFGRYRYRCDSSREGDFMLTGFSPRQSNLVVYVLPGIGDDLAVRASTRSPSRASTSTSWPTSISTCSPRS